MNNKENKIFYDFFEDMGMVTGIMDGIVTIKGLSKVSFGESVEFMVGDSTVDSIVGNGIKHSKKLCLFCCIWSMSIFLL